MKDKEGTRFEEEIIDRRRKMWSLYFLYSGILCILFLCIGLVLGGAVVKNSNDALERMMAETKEDIEQHPYSAVLVDIDVAKAVGFEPRDFDCVIEGGV